MGEAHILLGERDVSAAGAVPAFSCGCSGTSTLRKRAFPRDQKRATGAYQVGARRKRSAARLAKIRQRNDDLLFVKWQDSAPHNRKAGGCRSGCIPARQDSVKSL
jgi:hypothetical protein